MLSTGSKFKSTPSLIEFVREEGNQFGKCSEAGRMEKAIARKLRLGFCRTPPYGFGISVFIRAHPMFWNSST